MGVKGLFQFLKRFEKEISIPQFVKNKSVGIDIFWFLYQSKGDTFILQSMLVPLIRNAKTAHCVFDGKPSREKIEALRQQAKHREEIQYSIDNIEAFLRYPFSRITAQDRRELVAYLNQLKRQIWTPSPSFIASIQDWLQCQGCTVYTAKEEADDLLIELEKTGIIDTIVTNDSDLLALGSSSVVRIKTPTKGTLYDKNYIQKELQFSDKQWSDFTLLCRYMTEKDITLAYSIISAYKDLEYGLQKYTINTKNDTMDMLTDYSIISIIPSADTL